MAIGEGQVVTGKPDFARIAGRVAHVLRQVYGHRVREVSWDPTLATLLLHVELIGPFDRASETVKCAKAVYPIAVAEGITFIVVPIEAGKKPWALPNHQT